MALVVHVALASTARDAAVVALVTRFGAVVVRPGSVGIIETTLALTVLKWKGFMVRYI